MSNTNFYIIFAMIVAFFVGAVLVEWVPTISVGVVLVELVGGFFCGYFYEKKSLSTSKVTTTNNVGKEVKKPSNKSGNKSSQKKSTVNK